MARLSGRLASPAVRAILVNDQNRWQGSISTGPVAAASQRPKEYQLVRMEAPACCACVPPVFEQFPILLAVHGRSSRRPRTPIHRLGGSGPDGRGGRTGIPFAGIAGSAVSLASNSTSPPVRDHRERYHRRIQQPLAAAGACRQRRRQRQGRGDFCPPRNYRPSSVRSGAPVDALA